MSITAIISYIVLTLAVGYAFILPTYNDLTVLNEEKQKYNDALETVANIEIRKNELLSKFNSISAEDKKSIEVFLPDSVSFVRLISEIDSLASKQGISIDRISSRDTDPSVGATIEDAGPQKPYRSSVIGFSFTASYDKFRIFMDDLEKSLRILDIKSLRISPEREGLFVYNVEFETYWFRQ